MSVLKQIFFVTQKIPQILEKLNLWRDLTDRELSEEVGETERFNKQLRALSNNQHLSQTSLDSTLSSQVNCRSAELDNKKRALEVGPSLVTIMTFYLEVYK